METANHKCFVILTYSRESSDVIRTGQLRLELSELNDYLETHRFLMMVDSEGTPGHHLDVCRVRTYLEEQCYGKDQSQWFLGPYRVYQLTQVLIDYREAQCGEIVVPTHPQHWDAYDEIWLALERFTLYQEPPEIPKILDHTAVARWFAERARPPFCTIEVHVWFSLARLARAQLGVDTEASAVRESEVQP